MAEEKRTDWGKVLLGVGVIGGVAVAGYGIYRLSEFLSAQEKAKWELITEYLAELDEMVEFQRGLIERGMVTDLERQLLDTMVKAMDQKQVWIETYSTHWLVDLAKAVEGDLKSFGLYVLIPIVASIALFVAWRIFKHWPLSKRQPPPEPTSPPPPPVPAVPPPPFVCPKDGLMFATSDALLNHIRNEHRINTNPADIRQAQAYLNQTSPFTQTLVAMESGLYNTMYIDWIVIGVAALILIAVGIAIVLSVGTATPGVIAGAYSVVAQAEAILARTAVVAVLV